MSSEPGEAAPTAGKIARCPWCDCRIIDTAAAEKVDKEFENITYPAASSSEPVADSSVSLDQPMKTFWSANQWKYDNVGVSKPPSAEARHRFLTCADCDRGPLGLCFPKDEPEQLYLAADRVKYTDQ